MTTITTDPTELEGEVSSFTADKAVPVMQEPAVNASGNTHTGDSAFMIIGERAFPSKDAVIQKIQHADAHIQTLESERAKDRENIKSLTAELSKLKLAIEGRQGEQQQVSGNQEPTASLSKEELVKAVKEELTAEQREVIRVNNINTVFSEAKAKYGDEVVSVVNKKGQELGITSEEIDEMAKSRPKLFRSLFLPQQKDNGKSAHFTTSEVKSALTAGLPNEPVRVNWSKAKSTDVAKEVARRLRESTQ